MVWKEKTEEENKKTKKTVKLIILSALIQIPEEFIFSLTNTYCISVFESSTAQLSKLAKRGNIIICR